VAMFIQSYEEAPAELVLDVDATDDPVHGEQEGRFFHGYYGEYCYLPLYIVCEGQVLCARLRASNIDASEGVVEELMRIVGQLREAWPQVKITVRGDSGFAREGLMSWCESAKVDYVLGLARNCRLEKLLEPEMEQARQEYERTGKAARCFKDFVYKTRDSWSRERRVVGKAEHLAKGPNPRFVVTSLGGGAVGGQRLIRAAVLCTGGDGEPDQGATAGSVCRPNQR
jgi:hypothetical protein